MGSRRLWFLLPRQLRELPADIAAVALLTVAVNLSVFLPVVNETPARVVLGVAFVLFVPGYALIAALFPEAGTAPTEESDEGLTERGIDEIERAALSFGLSIAVVPLIGLALNFTPWGITLVPIMVGLSAFTGACLAVAAIRRWNLPEEERFRVPYRSWFEGLRGSIFAADSRLDAVLNAALVLSIVLAVGVLAFAVLFPPQGEAFSALYLLTEDEDGDLVAAGYPTEMEVGEDHEIIVGIDNHEGETVEYTVVVLEQAVTEEANETVVTNQSELDRFAVELADNETHHEPYDLSPTMTGDPIRVVWLLFTDEVPSDPSREDTEYSTHLWLEVNE